MTKNDLPNLFIIGAPKCGTTSMFLWLADHPEVCPSEPKETWFFAGEELDYLKIRPNHREDTIESYLECFAGVSDITKVKMEGSTHYLYSESALNFLSLMEPKPKIIVQLREPANRIWSHFNYVKQRSQSPIHLEFPDFVERLLSVESRLGEPMAKDLWPSHLLRNQLSYSDYYMHISKWTSRFPAENLFITTLEELAENKREAVKGIAEWIGIDSSFYDHYQFSTENSTRSHGAESFRRRLSGMSKVFPKAVKRRAKSLVDRTLSASRPRRNLGDEQSLLRLSTYFHDANNQLSTELGVDVSRWRSP